MADRETVIYDIERCICHVPDACKDCSKYGGDNAIRCMEELLADALSLLKAQEPIKPKVNVDTLVCGNCGTRIERQSMIGPNTVLAETFKFCPECGKKVDWNG